MSKSDVELIRRGFEELEREGWEKALLPLIADDFELTTPPSLSAEPDTYRGPEGLRRYFESFYEVMEEIHFRPHEFRVVGEWIVAPCTLTARGRATGLEAEQFAVLAWMVRDGKAVRVKVFAELEEALAALADPDG
ncbi:MAG: nuclear transport factor 2 family protein [Solirubrobacterales bacterium]